MARYKLDTGNSGDDEILEGETRAEVLQDVLNHHGIDELPEGWTLEELDADETDSEFSITWEFTGRSSPDKSKAAEAVAHAMELLKVTVVNKKVLQIAADSLGGEWDVRSVEALIENCGFEKV
jgi:hypothetical protein